MLNVIKASAGSGKTFKLAYEYIKLLLAQKVEVQSGKEAGTFKYQLKEGRKEYHQHILAVTFTNMATKEMKDRIVKELTLLINEEEESKYLEDLCNELDVKGASTREDKVKAIRKAAKTALVELLFDYSNFNVSTIDAFFQVILRTFAREVDLNYNYNIELDDTYVVRMGVNRFLSDVNNGVFSEGSNRHFNPEDWVREYISHKVNDNKSWNIFSNVERVSSGNSYGSSDDLADFAKVLNKDSFKRISDELTDYFGEDGAKVLDFKKALAANLIRERDAGITALKQLIEFVQRKGGEMKISGGVSWAVRVLQELNESNDFEKALDKDKKLFDERNEEADNLSFDDVEKWYRKNKMGEWSEADVGEAASYLSAYATRLKKARFMKKLNDGIYNFALLGEINKYMTKFRQENGMILLSDTNDLLQRIIGKDETPFIYERVGMWLNHYLVDEFQDTARTQWKNMKPLIENSESLNNDNLIIGDEKQSIYRFRDSDMKLLMGLGNTEFTSANVRSMDTNWRSDARVVRFNNTFFTYLAKNISDDKKLLDMVGNVYQSVIQKVPAKKLEDEIGYVRCEVLQKPEDEDNAWYEEEALNRTVEQLKDAVGRGFRKNRIAVLVDTNKEGAKVIARLLDYNSREENEVKLDVMSSESLMLKNSAAVKMIVSTLRYLSNRNLLTDDGEETEEGYLARQKRAEDRTYRVLRQYEENLSKNLLNDDADLELAGDALAEAFRQVSENEDGAQDFVSNIITNKAQVHNLVAIVERIVKVMIADDLRKEEEAFILEFMDLVNDFCSRGNGSFYSFLKWWDQGGCNSSVKSPSGKDAINVMTIHKSKGLEFDCVIIPFCNWELANKDKEVWIKREHVLESGLLDDIDEKIVPPVLLVNSDKKYCLESTSGMGDALRENSTECLIDKLNMTYVAFTRAIDEMYLYMKEPKGEKSVGDNVAQALISFVDGCVDGNVQKALEIDDFNWGILPNKMEDGFEVGEPLAVKVYKNDEKEMAKAENKTEAVDSSAESGEGKRELKFSTPDLRTNDQRERGLLMHDVMRRMRYMDDMDSVLLYMRKRASLTDEEFADVQQMIERAFSDERVKEWFAKGNKVYNERTIVTEKSEERKEKGNERPDRFIVTPDGRTVVVDYKFGKEQDSYLSQVRNYMDVLERCGCENVEGYVWYPEKGKILKVD